LCAYDRATANQTYSSLKSRLDRENRRQQKDQDRLKLYKEVKARLDDELRQHEDIQAQLHGAGESIARRRSYADNAEKEIETLTSAVSDGSIREDELAIELATLQVQFNTYQARMDGIEQELQKARDMTDEITTNRDKARDEARQVREERRQEAERKLLDAARHEGMMQGKVEGMHNGWEEGKFLGYKEGRKDGAHEQHEEMNRKWRAIKRELPNYDLDDRIPSPESSYNGDVPERLKTLGAPIIVPLPKKARTSAAPPPATIYYDDDDYIRPNPIHSSPEQIHQEFRPSGSRAHRAPQPPPPVPPNLYGNTMITQAPIINLEPASWGPSSSRSGQIQQQRPRANMPPPQPIFGQTQDEWQPPIIRPDDLKRSKTWQKLEKRFTSKPREISHAPHDMDFAPMAAPLPYPAVATPLPHSQTLQPGRAPPTPAPSTFREPAYNEEESADERRGHPGQRYADQPETAKSGMLSRLTSLVRGGRSQPAVDPMNHPLGYRDVHSTPTLPGQNSIMIASPTTSPSSRHRNLSQPGTPVWPLPSPQHTRLSQLPDNGIPSLDAAGEISLPPPHGLHGSAMQSAINISSQNPSHNPSPSPSQRSFQRERSRSREPSPIKKRFSQISHSLRDAAGAAGAALQHIPSHSRIQAESRGRSRSRSPITPDSPSPIQQPRDRSRSRSRPRSTIDNPYFAVPSEGLHIPEHIMVGPTISDPNLVDDTSVRRGRGPVHKGTATSQISGKSSPISQMSILSMGGALGLSRGSEHREPREPNFVTYPANLSMIEEEWPRHSNYNPSPSPTFRRAAENILPVVAAEQQFPHRPPPMDRHFSDSSVTMADNRETWDSRYPPPPPSMRSIASGNPPHPPMKSPQTDNTPYPWPNRPVPSKLQMPALLSATSPTSSSRGGIAGIGAGGGYHKRAASASALGLPLGDRNFTSPHPSTRLVSTCQITMIRAHHFLVDGCWQRKWETSNCS